MAPTWTKRGGEVNTWKSGVAPQGVDFTEEFGGGARRSRTALTGFAIPLVDDFFMFFRVEEVTDIYTKQELKPIITQQALNNLSVSLIHHAYMMPTWPEGGHFEAYSQPIRLHPRAR